MPGCLNLIWRPSTDHTWKAADMHITHKRLKASLYVCVCQHKIMVPVYGSFSTDDTSLSRASAKAPVRLIQWHHERCMKERGGRESWPASSDRGDSDSDAHLIPSLKRAGCIDEHGEWCMYECPNHGGPHGLECGYKDYEGLDRSPSDV